MPRRSGTRTSPVGTPKYAAASAPAYACASPELVYAFGLPLMSLPVPEWPSRNVFANAGAVGAREAIRGGELLCGRDGLEVHAEDRRRPDLGGAAVVEAVDLVQDRVDLVAVVAHGESVVARPVAGRAGRRRVTVDLGREEILDAGSRRAIEDLVGGVLVRPGRTQAGRASDLEDRVHLEVLVRVDRLAADRIDWELGGVDERGRVARHLQDPVRQPREPL